MPPRLARTLAALSEALGQRSPQEIACAGSVAAAVFMPLMETEAGIEVVFTKRNSRLPHHPGQVSFPGGAADPEDPDLETTALRETCEEIGICLDQARLVARLDQVVTVTNFLVTPFVGGIVPLDGFTLAPDEVEKLVVVPLAKVLDPAQYPPTTVEWEGMALSQRALRHDGEVIWGATARILHSLLEALGPHAARVVAAAG